MQTDDSKENMQLTSLWLQVFPWFSWSLNGLVSKKHPGLVQRADHQLFTLLQLGAKSLEEKTKAVRNGALITLKKGSL